MFTLTVKQGQLVNAVRRLSQATQFALAGGLVMLAAMTSAGIAISSIVSRAAVDTTATSSALFIDSLLEPLVQDLSSSSQLSAESISQLNALFAEGPFSSRFIHVDLWRPDGSVAYSTSEELIGDHFITPEGVSIAFTGAVDARHTDLSAREHTARGWLTKYLEIYVPLREHLSGRIIAVVEVHERAEPLDQKLFLLRVQTWLVVVGATVLIASALLAIVVSSGRLIAEQQLVLRKRLQEIERVSDQNRQLRKKIQRGAAGLAEMNEQYLRSVGAELHDGPAQLVGLAALKLEHIRRAPNRAARDTALGLTDAILGDALRDIRVIARGLMLPEIEGLSLSQIVHLAAKTHERRTDTAVEIRCPDYPGPISRALGIAVYRFVQEGLNNAFRHADGKDQLVECRLDGTILTLRVSDGGGGARPGKIGGGLGLTGLEERVESLGGTFAFRKSITGTIIEMIVAIDGEAT
jgi:signal transduction histidine kinase